MQKRKKDDKKNLLLYAAMFFVGVAIVFTMVGASIVSYSYGAAFKQGEIRICTGADLDYATLQSEVLRCRSAGTIRINFSLQTNSS